LEVGQTEGSEVNDNNEENVESEISLGE